MTLVGERFTSALANTCDEESFETVALRTGLGPMIARISGRFVIPEDELLFRRLRDRLLVEAAQELSAALGAGGVPHFFFKGVALIDVCYGLGERDLADIDLFVRPGHRAKAVSIVRGLGYESIADSLQAGPVELRSAETMLREPDRALEAQQVDLHWSLDPLDRLLPRGDRTLPEEFWRLQRNSNTLPVPPPGFHAALIVHHLVRSDYLHLRGIVDLARLVEGAPELSPDDLDEAAGMVRCRQAWRAMRLVLARDLGVGTNRERYSGNHALDRILRLDDWLRWWCRVPESEHAAISRRRLGMRIRSVGLTAVPGLLADVVFPPASFLSWRWPNVTVGRRLLLHYSQITRKIMGSG